MPRSDWKWLIASVLVTGVILGSALALAQQKGPALPEDMEDMRFVHALVVNDPTSPLFGFHHFYVNERGINALAKGGPYPEGTVFLGLAYQVKPEGNLINEGQGIGVFLMKKVPAASETGGWRFAVFDRDGKPVEIDTKSACFDCHTQAADRDYVFSQPLGLAALSQVWLGGQASSAGAPGDPAPHRAGLPRRRAEAAVSSGLLDPYRPDPDLRDGYPNIGDYALIGDCRAAALVSRWGSVDWLCLPHFSAGSMFAAILDRHRGGRFAIRPVDPSARVERRYVGDSVVLETVFRTDEGVVGLRDCMSLLPGGPADGLDPERELLRMAECRAGSMELEVLYLPRPDYGRLRPRLYPRGALGWACPFRGQQIFLHSDASLSPSDDGSALPGRVSLRAGDRARFSMTYTGRDIAVIADLASAEHRLAASLDWWQSWSDTCLYEGPYRAQVLRSLITLKLLTYAPSGAVVAAPTTSLPENPGGVRNWDYRYCWLRDAALTFDAFADTGHYREAESFLGWLLHTTRLTWPGLSVLYDVYGETHLPERELDHLEGYRGSRPVRIGNAARSQLQLDTYGAVMVAARQYVRAGGTLDWQESRMLKALGRRVSQVWQEPDAGIWELRGPPRQHTHSKLMCWVALDGLLELDARGALKTGIDADALRRERTRIASAIEAQAWNPERGTYTATFGGDQVEAGLLLMAHYGFKAADDPRMQGTWRCIDEDLGRDALLLRYPHGADGLPPGEGAFVICSFWAVDYLARLGRIEEAEGRFESLLGLANDLGLLAEEANFGSGEPLGNFPQAYSHVGLLMAAQALEAAQGRARKAAGGFDHAEQADNESGKTIGEE